MGEPVRIADVASRLASLADRPVEIVYTGLRPGEKRREVLIGKAEREAATEHPLIRKVAVPPLNPDRLDELGGIDGKELRHQLMVLSSESPHIESR
jgi:FlaA1/EpsC-like NDP-sugar epimerase